MSKCKKCGSTFKLTRNRHHTHWRAKCAANCGAKATKFYPSEHAAGMAWKIRNR